MREASEVEGHAVRALYLTAGVADVYLETGEQALLDAVERQWHDMVTRKLYITGGVGSRHLAEAFGKPYELPNELAYCETCAAIASIMWCWRMLLITGEARFADLAERTLYNAVLSGVSLDGAAATSTSTRWRTTASRSTCIAAARAASRGTTSPAARRT